MTDIKIGKARSSLDITAVKTLFQEYAEDLGVDLCFQGFEEEMRTFPDKYVVLLLARLDGAAAGAVGLKDLGAGTCEMKRLFVRPALRGHALGRRLSEMLISEARVRGFARMRLDTLERLKPALALYETLGFRRISAYYGNPLDEVVYMELTL